MNESTYFFQLNSLSTSSYELSDHCLQASKGTPSNRLYIIGGQGEAMATSVWQFHCVAERNAKRSRCPVITATCKICHVACHQ